MKRLFPLILALTLFSVGSAFAQPQPDSAAIQARVEAQNAFRQQPEAGAWTLRRHEITQTPVSIFGGPSQALQLQGRNPKAKARGFFARHRQMFGYRPNGDELEVEYVRERRGFAYVQLNQRYKGIPVHRGGYKVKMTREGRLRMISGRFFPDIDVGVTPGLSASRATEIAARATSSDSLMNEPESELVIYPGEGRYTLAYKVRLSGPPPQSWRVFVDAQSGDVLEKENVTMHLASTTTRASSSSRPSPRSTVSPPTTIGSGKIYLDNPNDGSTVTTDLPRLSGNGSSLSGTFAEAHNYGGNNASPTSSPATYYFSPSNTHFDEVNLYYHADRYADHLPSIGFPGLGRTIEAYAHWSGCPSGGNCNNAFYDEPNNEGNGKQLYFGDGEGVIFRDFAKENDVIYHEFNHAVLDHLDIGYDTYPDETGALQEGTADYLAASFVNNPRMGQWVTKCTSTGDLRTVSNSASTFHYNNKSSVEYAYCSAEGQHLNEDQTRHAVGMIWSGALWDLRNVIGASTTDELVIEAFNSLSNTPDFLQARDALVQADNDLYGGANTCEIEQVFADRGIGESLSVLLSGPSSLDHAEQGTWTAPVSGGCGSTSYDWEYQPLSSSSWYEKSCGGVSCSHTFHNYSNYPKLGGIRVTVTKGDETDSDFIIVSVSTEGPCSLGCTFSSSEFFIRNIQATARKSGTARVRWQAGGSEVPSAFVVQHRTDSTAAWLPLGTVPAGDSSSVESSRAVAYRFHTEKLEIGTHQFRVGLPQDADTGPRAVGTSRDDNPQRFTGPVTARIKMDEAYRLSTYPNPVQQRVTVELAIQERQDVQVRLYDVLGRRVTTLRNGPMPAQELRRLRLDVSATGLTSGTYFLRVRGEDFATTEQITVVR